MEELVKWKNHLHEKHFGINTQIKLDGLATGFKMMCENEPTKKEAEQAQKKDRRKREKVDP